MPRVTVLLSTFNGNQFLPSLLDSLDGQTYTNMDLLYRDDGSSDESEKTVREFKTDFNSRASDSTGSHLGFKNSYLQLILESEGFVAFSDQDDLWHSEKLQLMMEKYLDNFTVNEDSPVLITCGFDLIDTSGKKLSKKAHGIKSSMRNPIAESPPPGFSMLLNPALRDRVALTYPGDPYFHDYWTYMCAYYLGNVVSLDVALVSYRIHSGNAVGMNKSMTRAWKFLSNVMQGYPARREKYAHVLAFRNSLPETQATREKNHSLFFALEFVQMGMIKKISSIRKIKLSQSPLQTFIWKILAIFNYWF